MKRARRMGKKCAHRHVTRVSIRRTESSDSAMKRQRAQLKDGHGTRRAVLPKMCEWLIAQDAQSLVIRKMRIGGARRPLTRTRAAGVKKRTITSIGENGRNLVRPLWPTAGGSPESPLQPGDASRQGHPRYRPKTDGHVYTGISHTALTAAPFARAQVWKQPGARRQGNGETRVCFPHRGILLSREKGGKTDAGGCAVDDPESSTSSGKSRRERPRTD